MPTSLQLVSAYADQDTRFETAYRVLRDAGAVIVGVGNMHELGAGSTGNVSFYGAAHNPWNTERCPGGSSSGVPSNAATFF